MLGCFIGIFILSGIYVCHLIKNYYTVVVTGLQ